MRTIVALVALSWAFLLLRLADRPQDASAAPKVQTLSMSCSYERTDTVGGRPLSTERRAGPCFGPEGPSLAQRPP